MNVSALLLAVSHIVFGASREPLIGAVSSPDITRLVALERHQPGLRASLERAGVRVLGGVSSSLGSIRSYHDTVFVALPESDGFRDWGGFVDWIRGEEERRTGSGEIVVVDLGRRVSFILDYQQLLARGTGLQISDTTGYFRAPDRRPVESSVDLVRLTSSEVSWPPPGPIEPGFFRRTEISAMLDIGGRFFYELIDSDVEVGEDLEETVTYDNDRVLVDAVTGDRWTEEGSGGELYFRGRRGMSFDVIRDWVDTTGMSWQAAIVMGNAQYIWAFQPRTRRIQRLSLDPLVVLEDQKLDPSVPGRIEAVADEMESDDVSRRVVVSLVHDGERYRITRSQGERLFARIADWKGAVTVGQRPMLFLNGTRVQLDGPEVELDSLAWTDLPVASP